MAPELSCLYRKGQSLKGVKSKGLLLDNFRQMRHGSNKLCLGIWLGFFNCFLSAIRSFN